MERGRPTGQMEHDPRRDLDVVLPEGRGNQLLTGANDPVARWTGVAKKLGVRPDNFHAYRQWRGQDDPGVDR
jgi:hypothetical protein